MTGLFGNMASPLEGVADSDADHSSKTNPKPHRQRPSHLSRKTRKSYAIAKAVPSMGKLNTADGV